MCQKQYQYLPEYFITNTEQKNNSVTCVWQYHNIINVEQAVLSDPILR